MLYNVTGTPIYTIKEAIDKLNGMPPEEREEWENQVFVLGYQLYDKYILHCFTEEVMTEIYSGLGAAEGFVTTEIIKAILAEKGLNFLRGELAARKAAQAALAEEVAGGSKGGAGTKGYSYFADGMSPEDAARYINNNEQAFFNEFSERASAAGLNDVQITEAYNAMRAGDYSKMAFYFDTSSPLDGAVFWSGDKEGAAAYANSIGGTIMEQTSGGQVFDNWRGLGGMYPEWDTGTALDQKSIWKALSAQYAEGATGNVTYVVKAGYSNPNSVWKTVEYPILQDLFDDDIVTDIITIIIKE